MKIVPGFKSMLLAIFIAELFSVPHPAFSASASYFDMDEKRSEDTQPFPKWTTMVARFIEQRKVPDSECGKVRYHPCSILEWKNWLGGLHDKSLEEQMKAINHWGNEHPYVEDQVNWGVEDYWETPFEFMDVSGDCEDYAIAKYYSLKALGVPVENMRIIILQDLNLGGIVHAVLGVYNQGELFILDNQSQQVKPALKIYHYRPIFGINETSWWVYYPRLH